MAFWVLFAVEPLRVAGDVQNLLNPVPVISLYIVQLSYYNVLPGLQPKMKLKLFAKQAKQKKEFQLIKHPK